MKLACICYEQYVLQIKTMNYKKRHLDSVNTFGVMYDHTFSKLANNQIRHYSTQKMGCQPGDCIWSH